MFLFSILDIIDMVFDCYELKLWCSDLGGENIGEEDPLLNTAKCW